MILSLFDPVPCTWPSVRDKPTRPAPRHLCRNARRLTFWATEFKEIRKEWKQRKKEEEAARKAEDERQRQAAAAAQAAAQNGSGDPQSAPDGSSSASAYAPGRQVQLPPIGYQPSQYPAPPSAGGVAQQPLPEYNGSHMYSANYQPQSPYGQPNQSMYNSREFQIVCTNDLGELTVQADNGAQASSH